MHAVWFGGPKRRPFSWAGYNGSSVCFSRKLHERLFLARSQMGMSLLQFHSRCSVATLLPRELAKLESPKLAAMEAHYETGTGVPLLIGGVPDDAGKKVKYAIEIPYGLSILVGFQKIRF